VDVGTRHIQAIRENSSKWQKISNWRAGPAVVLGVLLVAAWSAAVAGLSWAGLLGAGLGWALLWLSVIDARHLILPDRITLPLIAAGLVAGYLLHPALLADHALGALAGYLALWGVGAVFQALRGHPGLGLGDAKLFAAAGAWLTWQGLPTVLAIASLAGLALALVNRVITGPGYRDKPLPFGPPLALGIWLVWLYGPILWVGLWVAAP
jgi:leader peptidase (prepilin peptidase)/N-methyltransferase